MVSSVLEENFLLIQESILLVYLRGRRVGGLETVDYSW